MKKQIINHSREDYFVTVSYKQIGKFILKAEPLSCLYLYGLPKTIYYKVKLEDNEG